jgi:hypothetical protein
MSRSSCLTVVVPQLLSGAIADVSQRQPGNSLLARIAGRGERTRRWVATSPEDARLDPWQRGLLASLALEESSHPSAPLSALGLGLNQEPAHWLHADAIHLAAGLNEVTLVPLHRDFALTAQECAALTPALRDHLAANGLQLHRTSSNDWLIESPSDWNAQTVSAQFALNHEWQEALPQGSSAGDLRRLMTELQMVLHEHPVNRQRNARGMPSANALWLWGNGRVGERAEIQPTACSGQRDYLRGICRLHEWMCSQDTAAQALIAKCAEAQHVVGIVEVDTLSELESQWLTPLVAALKRGSFDRLRLILDEWELGIDRWRLNAFWRGDLPLTAWSRA